MKFAKREMTRLKVYLSFIDPKTQKEAVEMIYNKDYENINMRPFRQAREELQNTGRLDWDGKMRNGTFTSVGDFEDRSKYTRENLLQTDILTTDEEDRMTFDSSKVKSLLLNEIFNSI
ncbi:MAG: hypothetical protein ABEI78_01080 [Candidatus Nanohaloarchaea archaeon]